MKTNRRDALKAAIMGGGLVGLKSLATGLPTWAFTHGLTDQRVWAADPVDPKFLLLITSSAGDPFNANVPGVYGVDGVTTNPQSEMAPTTLQLGSVSTTAAAPWASLPQWALDRTAFVHHRTYQNAHPQYQKVMGLVGSAKNAEGGGTEHMASLISSEMAGLLGTIQEEPVALGRHSLSFRGAQLQAIAPSTLSEIFSLPEGRNLELANIRKQAIDDLYALAKEGGSRKQLAFIDKYATSRLQVEQLDAALVERFSMISGNDALNQLRAALTLFMMRLTSVATVHIAFGSDNHFDAGLTRERDETVAALGVLRQFLGELENSPLRDQVVIANLNVFGRTLGKKGDAGRDHNLNHHAMMIMGSGIEAGVYGGLEPSGNDFGATDLDSATGAGVEGGDIPKNESLEATTKTLATVIGVPEESIDRRIEGGRVISAALKGA